VAVTVAVVGVGKEWKFPVEGCGEGDEGDEAAGVGEGWDAMG
jgi:hypothetical protein